ncbi:ABC transporter ATP-binding protein, partial [uncultured Clostridium sp.]|uniref:ABC transporter ATP-binding protein n=1 Tax=uncultured Clostridium sp. TaxID=59620 RepID=UPI0025E3895D
MIKELSKSIRDYKKDTIKTSIFVVCEIILDILIPIIMGLLVDHGISTGNTKNILFYGILFILSAIVALFFGFMSGKSASIASNGFVKNLRQDVFEKVNDFSFKNIDKFSTSSLITRLTTDASNVQNAFQMIIRIAVRAPLMFIFSIAAVIYVNPKIASIFIIIIPILVFGLYYITTKAYPLFARTFKTYDKLNNVVEENVRSIRVVKSFNNEEHEINKFENVSNDIYTTFSKAEKIVAFNTPLMQSAIYAAIIIICWIGGKLIISTGEVEMTTGNLTACLTYATMILNSLMMLSMILVMLNIAKSSAERIVEVLREDADIKSKENPKVNVENGNIDFKNVYFKYESDQDKYVLSNINISIKEGEFIGIIGGTGSSKSSLVNLIPRLYDTTKGSVCVGNIDVKDYDLEVLLDNVSIVLQKNVLFSGTILENLRWGKRDASIEEAREMCKIAQIDDFIMSLPDKYDTLI